MDTEFRTISSLITSLLTKKEENHLKIWNRINLYDCLDDYSFDDSLKKEIDHFINVLNKIKRDDEKNETLKDGKVISDIINFLKEYENSGVFLPGVEMKIADFVKALEKQNKKNQKMITHSQNIYHSIHLLDEFDKKMKTVEKELPKLKNLSKKEVDYSDSTDAVDNTSELNDFTKRKKEIEDKIKFYYLGCMAKNIEVDSLDEDSIKSKIYEMQKNTELAPYFSYKEKLLTDKINQLETEIRNVNNDIEERDLFLRDYERDIKKLEDKEPHKYQNYSNELNRLYKIYERLKGKLLNEYNLNIKALVNIEQNSSSNLKDVKNQKYFLEVSKYLGKRIGSFRHIEKTYNAARINLISGEIITMDNQIIRLTDMGTGQGQSAYLLGLLNTNDNRKIIALFDEVAMMDSVSLEPIYEKFKDLYDADRLLVGIVVQKADEIKITSKMS